jgi:hypothetical protein
MSNYSDRKFPEFSLKRLLETCFEPKTGERVAILIDLDDPTQFKQFNFLNNSKYSVQKNAIEYFYKPLNEYLLAEMNLRGGEIYAYQETGGSNLDLPETAVDQNGNQVSFADAIYSKYDLILCISSYSATAPLTATAKEYGFRGATLHGVNDIILSSGLSVDYSEVSAEAEKLRRGFTKADAVEIDFEFFGQSSTLRLELAKQEAQKSHGLCPVGPDIANLPAGEVYFVPTGAEGAFPRRYEDGSIALLEVSDGRVTGAKLIAGGESELTANLEVLKEDPAAGLIGELGFGTQKLPVSGQDIQDEKILGTVHVATGRSDHLGGDIVPGMFKHAKNASHDDILFSPEKTPEINVSQVRLFKGGREEVVIENFKPSSFVDGLLSA